MNSHWHCQLTLDKELANESNDPWNKEKKQQSGSLLERLDSKELFVNSCYMQGFEENYDHAIICTPKYPKYVIQSCRNSARQIVVLILSLYRYYAVIVMIGEDTVCSINVEDIGPFNKKEAYTANSNGQSYTYITGIVETSDISDYPYPYIVGDESRSSVSGVNYENVRLRSNTMYAVLVRAHTTSDLVSQCLYCIV